MDEYTSEIFMGGHNTIVLHNTCEDSLLAAPIILDLVILAELCERIEIKRGTHVFCVSHHLFPSSPFLSNVLLNSPCPFLFDCFPSQLLSFCLESGQFEHFHPVLSLLSYLLKAPMVPNNTPVVNALFRQRACIENIFR